MKWDSFGLDFTSSPPGVLLKSMKKDPLQGHKTTSPNHCCSCSIKHAPDINRHASTCQYEADWIDVFVINWKMRGCRLITKCACVFAHHMNSSSIPNSRGEKNVRSLAALPTGGSAFCGALEDGMGEVLVSGKTIRRKHNKPYWAHF